MVYRYSVKKNKKIYLLFICIACLMLGVLLAFIVSGPIIGTIASLVALFFLYPAGKLVMQIPGSWIMTHDDGISIFRPDAETVRFSWDSISLAGLLQRENRPDSIFVYAEKMDKYAEIPDEYTDFEALANELRAKTVYRDYTIDQSTNTRDFIASIIGMDSSTLPEKHE